MVCSYCPCTFLSNALLGRKHELNYVCTHLSVMFCYKIRFVLFHEEQLFVPVHTPVSSRFPTITVSLLSLTLFSYQDPTTHYHSVPLGLWRVA